MICDPYFFETGFTCCDSWVQGQNCELIDDHCYAAALLNATLWLLIMATDVMQQQRNCGECYFLYGPCQGYVTWALLACSQSEKVCIVP